MTRRIGIWFIAIILVLTSQIACSKQRAGTNRPNILLVSVCSIRPDHMSLYGYARETTPYLDRFAESSIVFDAAISQWPKTTPAFSTLMTGKYGHTTGVMRITPRQRLGDEHDTLAELLQREGYRTGAFVSTAALHRGTNLSQGFHVFEETYRSLQHDIDAANSAVRWLGERGDEPFLCWVHFNGAHKPYRAPGAPPDLFVDDEHYRSREIRLNQNRPLPLDVSKNHPCYEQIVRADLGGAHPSAVLPERPKDLGYYVARYDAGIYGVDRRIELVLRAAEDLELLDDTIVVLVGDHGEALSGHGYYFGHGRLPYDDCARVPFLIRPAGGVAAARIEDPVAAFSLTPTLLEMAGVAIPDSVEAKSVWGLTEGRGKAVRVFTESGYQMNFTVAVRDETWKLIHVPNSLDRELGTGSEYELYRWRDDPDERRDLQNAKPKKVAEMAKILASWSEPWVDEAYGRVPGQEPVDDETLERLKSIGYVD